MAPRRFQHRRHIIGRKARHDPAELIRPGINRRTIDRIKQSRDTFMANERQHSRRRQRQPSGNEQARLHVESLPRAVDELIKRRVAYANLVRRFTDRHQPAPLVNQYSQLIRIHTYIGGL